VCAFGGRVASDECILWEEGEVCVGRTGWIWVGGGVDGVNGTTFLFVLHSMHHMHHCLLLPSHCSHRGMCAGATPHQRISRARLTCTPQGLPVPQGVCCCAPLHSAMQMHPQPIVSNAMPVTCVTVTPACAQQWTPPASAPGIFLPGSPRMNTKLTLLLLLQTLRWPHSGAYSPPMMQRYSVAWLLTIMSDAGAASTEAACCVLPFVCVFAAVADTL
jgi:hypothetical protein